MRAQWHQRLKVDKSFWLNVPFLSKVKKKIGDNFDSIFLTNFLSQFEAGKKDEND